MKRMRKIVASFIATALLMVGVTSISANAVPLGINPEMASEFELSHTTTTKLPDIPYTLTHSNQQYVTSITAPSTSAAIFSFYTVPSHGSLSLYIKSVPSENASAEYNRVFDSTAHAPSLSFSIPAGTTYYVYISSSAATYYNPVEGAFSCTKTVA